MSLYFFNFEKNYILKIIKEIKDIDLKNPVVTIGTFDGVHEGHKEIIGNLKKSAKEINGETVVVTFEPHPRTVLYISGKPIYLLNSYNEKLGLLEKSGIDNLVIINFTSEFSKINYKDFIKEIIIEKIKAKKLIIGYDHHFGYNREGNFDYLNELSKQFNFEVEKIQPHLVNYKPVSSSKIREMLAERRITYANEFLGYDYMISGKVVEGNKIGREIGFPTANIQVDEPNKLVTADGVYAVRVSVENKIYKGMLNIGMRPTLNFNSRTIEVNIFDFNEDIYGKDIRVFFKERIRNEMKFLNIDSLKEQINKDKFKCLEILK